MEAPQVLIHHHKDSCGVVVVEGLRSWDQHALCRDGR